MVVMVTGIVTVVPETTGVPKVQATPAATGAEVVPVMPVPVMYLQVKLLSVTPAGRLNVTDSVFPDVAPEITVSAAETARTVAVKVVDCARLVVGSVAVKV